MNEIEAAIVYADIVGSGGGGGANIQPTKTATENGTVTPDSGYDALAEVIVNVSGSGSSAKFSSGTITLASEPTSPMIIEHGLGVIPNCIVFITGDKMGGSQSYLKGGWWFKGLLDSESLNKIELHTSYNNDFRGGKSNSQVVQNIDEDYFEVVNNYLIAGCTFYWFALYIDTTQ